MPPKLVSIYFFLFPLFFSSTDFVDRRNHCDNDPNTTLPIPRCRSNFTISLQIYTVRCAFSMRIPWYYSRHKKIRTVAATQ